MSEYKMQWFTVVTVDVDRSQNNTFQVMARNVEDVIKGVVKQSKEDRIQIIEIFKGALLGLLPSIVYTYDEED